MKNITKVDQNNIKWNKGHVLEVRAEKEKYRGSKDLKKAVDLLSQKIYKDDIHFILELIQNAEDEGAEEITIFLDRNKIIIKNNGRLFSKKDVRAICSIGGGNKKKKIGFMGIGFKSVFHITDSPQVISGQFNFTIHDYLYPEPQEYLNIETFEYEPKLGSIFVLPLNKLYKDNIIDFSKRLFDVDEKILLFLTHLRKIHFIDATGETISEWSYKRMTSGKFESVLNTKINHENTWRIFKKVLKVEDKSLIAGIEEKEGIENTTIVVAFPFPDIDSIDSCKNEPLYCYLPTEKPVQLPFILQADFIPNAGRTDIASNPKWNIWLFKELAIHVSESIIQLQNDELYFKYFYDFIPIVSDYYNEEILNKFLTPFHNFLKDEKVVYCKDNNWHEIENSTLIEVDLDNLLGIEECNAICGKSIFPAMISEFSSSAINVLNSFELSKIDINDIGSLFGNHNNLQEKHINWFLEIYYYLYKKCQDFEEWNLPEVFEELKTIPWLLTHDKTLVAPVIEGEDDRLVTYHPKEKNLGILPKIFEDGELVFLHKRLSREKGEKKFDEERKRIREFLVEQYEVSQFIDPHKIINDVILPKFKNGVYLNYKTKKIVILTNYIRENIKAWINKKKSARTSVDVNELYRELGGMLYLKVSWKKGKKTHNGFLHPDEAYISGRNKVRSNIFKMFSQIDEAPFISADYYSTYHVRGYSKADMVSRGRNVKSMPWDEFFKKIGAWEIPRVIFNEPVSIKRNLSSWNFINDLPKPVNYEGYTITEDWVMPEFEKVIEIYNKKPRKGKKLLDEFKNQIISKWGNYNRFISSKIEWYYRRSHSKKIGNSTFLHSLQTTNWFSVNGDTPTQPDEYFIYSEENRKLLPPDTRFIHDDKHKTFYRDIGIQEKPEKEKVFTYFKIIRKKWKNDSFPDNYADILTEIYSYLLEDDSIEDYLPKLKRFQSVFIPTKKQLWWHPSQAFWNDHFNTFGRHRIYLEELYPTDAKDFFNLFGVEEDPSINSSIDALNEIKKNKLIDFDTIQYANDIYRYIDKLAQKKNDIDFSLLSAPLFVSKQKTFHFPQEIFYVDDPRYDSFNLDEAKVFYSISSNHLLKNFFKVAKIRPLSDIYKIKCKKTNKSSLTNADSNIITSIGQHLKPFVQYNHPDAPESFHKKLSKLEDLSCYKVDSLSIQIIVNDGNKVDEQKNLEVYLEEHKDNIDLIMINDGNPMIEKSGAVSYELNRIFWEFGYTDLKMLIKELIECETLEDRNNVIRNHGIPDEIIDLVQDEKVHEILKGTQIQLPKGGQTKDTKSVIIKTETELTQSDTEYSKSTTEYRSWDEITHKVTVNVHDNKNGDNNVNDKEKSKKIREAVNPGDKKQSINNKITSGMITEKHALNIVMSFENEEGRNPIDVHDQKKVGYDIKCDDRFIEVKSFSGRKGQLTITPYEFKAAKKYKENFYIYVVSQLTTEYDKIEIEIIQNPISIIDFKIPGNRVAKNYAGQKIIYLECDNFKENNEK